MRIEELENGVKYELTLPRLEVLNEIWEFSGI
jgi:hypothetical protein